MEQSNLGPLAELLASDDVEDIYVLGKERVVVVTSDGQRRLLTMNPATHDALMAGIAEAVARDNRQLDGAHPCVDGRLPDGSRFHVALYPVAEPSPQIVVRRHRRLFRPGQDRLRRLIRLGTLTPQVALLLRYAIRSGVSILVAGPTAVGKTTLISGLGGEIDPLKAVVCIEDSRELDLPGDNVCYLLARPAAADGGFPVTQRFLVQQSLRKRPEFIILGEARGDEAWDFTQAGNTGHTILGSVHANSARDAIYRYRDMCLQVGGNLEDAMVLRNVLRSFPLIIYMAQLAPSSRRVVSHVANATGSVSDTKIPVLHDLFVWDKGELRCTQARPYPNLEEPISRHGYNYDDVVRQRDIPREWITAARRAASPEES